MPDQLTDEQRTELRQTLTANADTRAGEAWEGVDLNAASDPELLAYDRLRRLLAPVDRGISNPDGSRQVWNEETGEWTYVPSPKGPLPTPRGKQPASVAEFIANGGGTQDDREVWASMQAYNQTRRTEVLERLTANMSDERRTQFWTRHASKPIKELEEMLELLPPAQPQIADLMGGAYGHGYSGSQPLANYFGGQGAPTVPVTDEQPLTVPVINFGTLTKAR